jgi:TusA-related sulfurtransferase
VTARAADHGANAVPAARVDVRPYACPMTYVKTRIALERLAPGEILEVLLRGGEPLENVPRSAAEEGHRVLAVEPLEDGPDGFRVLLAKGSLGRGGGGDPWP